VEFGQYGDECELGPTAGSKVQIRDEWVGGEHPGEPKISIGSGLMESNLKSRKELELKPMKPVPGHVYEAVSSWTVYHFHDTSMLAPMRREQLVHDRQRLRPDAANIAAFLLALSKSQPDRYQLIRDTVRLIAPFFDDFLS